MEDLLRKNISLAVYQAAGFLKKNAIIGEVNISLACVWSQNCELARLWLPPSNPLLIQCLTDHSFVKKWAVLEKVGGDNKNKTVGYLQLDLAIVSANEPPAPIGLLSYDDEVIEE